MYSSLLVGHVHKLHENGPAEYTYCQVVLECFELVFAHGLHAELYKERTHGLPVFLVQLEEHFDAVVLGIPSRRGGVGERPVESLHNSIVGLERTRATDKSISIHSLKKCPQLKSSFRKQRRAQNNQ